MKFPKLQGFKGFALVIVLVALGFYAKDWAWHKLNSAEASAPATPPAKSELEKKMEQVLSQNEALKKDMEALKKPAPPQTPATPASGLGEALKNGVNFIAQGVVNIQNAGGESDLDTKMDSKGALQVRAKNGGAPKAAKKADSGDYLDKAERIGRLEEEIDTHKHGLDLAQYFLRNAPHGKIGDLERLAQKREITFQQRQIATIEAELKSLKASR